MNLLMAELGVDYTIARLRIKDNDQQKFLANIGFIEGAVLSVVSETMGNLIVKIKGSRVAIGKDIARRIDVTVIGG
ncbi:FeoA domain [Urinicoccus massiliensis]|uniref:FeoA domain n=1 Tax=Urinicoccus massiliensis TaxID=1723382 RepID=A0A8H2QSK1_9FIRM|nr:MULTISPECIES: FeoA family protein [Urinicoccus]EGS31627.1 FeoA domain protein [Peptoniphilus sp. oral taxon 375 str. F0436]KGF09883.1 iron transporter FeoA [Tissierellia bacterium S5-A11]VFB16991.1 FeoA domain [Urinicoccus massiliensis]